MLGATTMALATRTLLTPARTMVLDHPVLSEWMRPRNENGMRGFFSDGNGHLWVMPAKDEKLQGTNPSIALVDEAEFVSLDILSALEDRLGKRPEQQIIAFGTPGPSTDCVLHHIRTLASSGAYSFTEHSAPLDADIRDPATWRLANPAIDAGVLGISALSDAIAKIDATTDDSTKLILETRFRRFRLGQWISGAVEHSWLPAGAWAACPVAPPPPDGEPIVVAIDGTYRRSTAIVGASLETGAVFLLWAGEAADDDEVETVVAETCARWRVQEISYYPTIRANLIAQLDHRGFPMVPWPLQRQEEARCTQRAVERRRRGTPDPRRQRASAQHFANLAFRDTPAGVILRRLHDDGAWIDAAMACRMAWWRALEVNRLTPAIYERRRPLAMHARSRLLIGP